MNKNLRFLKNHYFKASTRFSRLGGQTNTNWLAESGGKKFFVRIPWETDAIDRKNEGRNILALSQNRRVKGIVPRYFLYVVNKKNILDSKDKTGYLLPDGTMITQYIKGRELTPRMFLQKKYQKALAKLLEKFHKSKVRFLNPYDPLRDEVQKYRLIATRHPLNKFFPKEVIGKLKALEKEAGKHLKASQKGISAHNDIILQNILVGENDRLYLVDFAYAGFNERGGIFYDLGYVLRDSFFNPPPIKQKTFEQFLSFADKAYKRKLNREQIEWAVVAAALVGIWWGILRYFDASKKERPYFQRYVERGVQGLFAFVKSKEKGARKS